MSILLYLIIGGVMGWFASLIIGKSVPGGVVGNVITGIIGAWIGGNLFGSWGPRLGDFYVVPTIVGALIFVIVVSYMMKAARKHR
ncbi:GlsB/YeaQ/YmgE family stress response membrane protein [Sporosarcina sp. P18a]|uniref:GlsB/YeaQ/YmgE family stress response membrane protein n=1 Tax=unclassified Sporosarcina TaxID=2647733 RepID=UPI000C16F45D|nr:MULTISPECIES: GlsB/YeaQ/YmgE family stress response membrane protein [unclassified Sporosarcina]PIC71197.1 GlsB/YeaQ/YmgE family stress response membrane protein [Sporosarcina sp. P16b]PIC80177.1 GlsB/YeaQ/YmgE family stress response membrane protein [Sporosarcina sp. P18a]PID01555.1 GlsB/YeaQ/YmgE family stress response membrane protein [Sporosarcina sp. P2]